MYSLYSLLHITAFVVTWQQWPNANDGAETNTDKEGQGHRQLWAATAPSQLVRHDRFEAISKYKYMVYYSAYGKGKCSWDMPFRALES